MQGLGRLYDFETVPSLMIRLYNVDLCSLLKCKFKSKLL
jgi:hypothetical protein